MEMGNSATDTATLAFTFSGTSTVRTWELKATQIPCGGPMRPPDGCLQYHTTLAGRFQTFNFADSSSPAHLATQKYVKTDIFAYLQGYTILPDDCLTAHSNLIKTSFSTR